MSDCAIVPEHFIRLVFIALDIFFKVSLAKIASIVQNFPGFDFYYIRKFFILQVGGEKREAWKGR